MLRPHPNPSHRFDERVRQHQLPPTFITPSYNSPSSRLHSSGASQQGMTPSKRKASSPARGASRANQPPPQTKAQQLQHPTPQSSSTKRGTPLHQASYANSSNSIPTSSTTAPNGSYASAPGFALGARNVATTSQDNQQVYPAALSSSAEQQGHTVTSHPPTSTFDPSISSEDAAYNAQLASNAQMTAAAAQKVADASQMKHATQSKLQVKMHICDCCPKKPKKFDTLEELR